MNQHEKIVHGSLNQHPWHSKQTKMKRKEKKKAKIRDIFFFHPARCINTLSCTLTHIAAFNSAQENSITAYKESA